MPSGAFRPVVTTAFGGRIGSDVIAAPTLTGSGDPLVLVQNSTFVVGFALDWVQ
jgi:hypothetical protein